MFRKRWVAAAALAASAWAAPAASAETIYGLNENDDLVVFDSATPGTTATPVNITLPSGVTSIEGIDVRPATLQLYGLGQNGQLFRINTATGATTNIGTPLTITGTDFDIDFNPTVDRLRIVSDAEQNLRVNPNNGALVLADGNLTPAGNVTGAAYTRNAPLTGGTTTLFDIDTSTDQLLTQNPPNNGTLVTPLALGQNLVGDVGFDISTTSNATGDVGTDTAYVAGRTADTLDRLYTINTSTGALGSGTEIGGASKVKDIAVSMPLPLIAVLTTNTVTGAQQTFSVRADLPGTNVSAPVTVTGLASGERLVGIDRRPAGGMVYGVSDAEKVYTLNLQTGAATAISQTPFTPALNGTAFGLDFNPVPDRIRLVSDNEQNLRINQLTGTGVQTTDGTLTPAGEVTGAAYTNPVAGATATTLFYLETGADNLATTADPNAGALTTVGTLGEDFTANNGYDIAARFNQGFAVLDPALPSTDGPTLYNVNGFTPAAAPGDRRTASAGLVSGVTGATTVVTGATIVLDNILPAAPSPTYTVPTPTPTYTVPTVTPGPTVTPPYNQKVKPRLTARVKPKRDRKKPFRFTVDGKLQLPGSVSKTQGCKGTVRVIARKGNKVLGRRRTGVKSTCKYKVRVKLRSNKAGRKGTVKFTATYLGSSALKQATAKTKAKYGRNRK